MLDIAYRMVLPAKRRSSLIMRGPGQWFPHPHYVEMEAKGLEFADMEIYTEDGDMQGAFVTYVR